MRTSILVVAAALALVGQAYAFPVPPCFQGGLAVNDARHIASLRVRIDALCPCADFDGSTPEKSHGAFVACARAQIKIATGTQAGASLRKQCGGAVNRIYRNSTCGFPASAPRAVCCEAVLAKGTSKAEAKLPARCVDSPNGAVSRRVCWASTFPPEACALDGTDACKTLVVQNTVDVPSPVQPANTPGSPGVVVTNPKLITRFGGASFSLNNVRYTRHRLAGPTQPQPDAILVLVPGFEGGAGDFKILAENLITRAANDGFNLEVWAYDRRTNQLEDSEGLDLAEAHLDPSIALDWAYGGELSIPLDPVLATGPNRRAVFFDTQADVPFMASWTNLVFSRDIDVIVTAARAAARNQNVFLGGHSAGTGFTARYASTDFELTGAGPPDPGYAKVRGLVLLEGPGGSTGSAPLTSDTLDRIEAKFDGGLYGAVRDNAPRCVDGTTPCTIATEATDCAGQLPPVCTPPTTAYSVVAGLLNPRILTAGEVNAIQAILDPDGSESIVRVDQGATAGNNAVAKVPDLSSLSFLPHSTAFGALGSFLDDDGLVASVASFVSTSIGAPGPTVGGLLTWQDITEGPMPASVIPNNGPPPTTLPGVRWGQEKEVTRLDRLIGTFYVGQTNFTDLYYPNAGPSVTSVTGVCTASTCTVGKVGASCSANADCSQSVDLDSSALSVGRGRRDIENLTQAAAIDVPVIAVGATNGLAPVPGAYTPFATSIGTCTAPSCDGTPRMVDASNPNPAFPTFGGVPGGFEVVMAEGFAHVDVTTAEDDANNPIPTALVAFLERNAQ